MKNSEKINKIFLVKVILLYQENGTTYFLELIRSPGKKFPSMGDLPGGKVEIGELPGEAIQREVKEETGILLDTVNLLTLYEWGHYLEYCYCAIANTKEVILDPEEHVSFQWKLLEKLDQSLLHENVKKIIATQKEKIDNFLKNKT